MIEPNGRASNRRVRAAVGLLIAAPLGVACHHAVTDSSSRVLVHAEAAVRVHDVGPNAGTDPFELQARQNPLGVLHEALRSYDRRVRDYTCTFVKQEKVNGSLGKRQDVRVKFRQEPYSVFMEWTLNPDRAARVLYVKDKWTTKKGAQQAWVDPTGWAIDVLLGPKGGVLQNIHGSAAKGASRRPIDNFGFGKTLQLIIEYSEVADARGVLELNYLGRSELDGQPTYLFERVLPYTGPGGAPPCWTTRRTRAGRTHRLPSATSQSAPCGTYSASSPQSTGSHRADSYC